MIRGAYRFSYAIDKEKEKLGKCGTCKLMENCELLDDKVIQKLRNPEIDVPDYVMADRKKCILSNHRSFSHDENVEHVSDGIRDHYKIELEVFSKDIKTDTDARWEPCQPIYISAPTGKGKNTFVERTLIHYVKSLNRKYSLKKKVLVISNRKALKAQMEDRIKGGIYSKEFDPDFICGYPKFADVADVMTYQGILNKQKYLEQMQRERGSISNYLFVVCDEAHFFTSDSSFNPDTDKILNAIVQIFENTIRIYMTATPYDCIKYIEDAEYNNRFKNNIPTEPGVCYHFKRKYDFLNTKYYSNHDELIELIVKGKEKWLIFIDNTNSCDKLKERLEEAGMENDEVFAISADSKKDPTYQRMIVEEKFIENIRVVITTSVVDNGVNFRSVQNVVLSDVSRVKCMQMLGRARLDNPDSRITLYLQRFNENFIEKRLNKLEEQCDAYHSYSVAYEQGAARSDHKLSFIRKYYAQQSRDWEHAKQWFGWDIEYPEKVFPNEIARSLVKKSIPLYKSILKEMEENDKEQEVPGQEYLEHQLSWFGKTYEKDNDVTLVDTKEIERQKIEAGKNALSGFLESYIGKQMLEDEQDAFSKEFTKEHDKVFPREDKNKGRTHGLAKINKILGERGLSYKVSNKNREPNTGKTYWEVIRIEE